MDVQLNNKYFEKKSLKWPIIILVIGVIMLAAMPPLGIVLVIAGAAWIYFSINKITDEAYDRSVSSQVPNLKVQALKKLGVDEDEVKEIEPIVLSGYRFKGASKYKKGKDGKWRTNRYEAIVLMFSQSEVHCYTYSLNTTEANSLKEMTDVYFYRDIVTVSTDSETQPVTDSRTGKTEQANYEELVLRTTGGNALSVAINNSDDEIDRSINAMRQLLRAKKEA